MIKKYTLVAALVMSLANLTNFVYCQNWQTYPYSPPNSLLNFQDDDGYHPAPNTSTEWWYINMTLIGSAPQYKKYSVMLCYFRFANMRIFNIACETDNTFINDVLQQPFLPSSFTYQLGHWELTYTKPFPNAVNDYSRWTFPTDGKTYSYVYHAEDPVHNNGLDVKVVSNRSPMVVGGNGYIALGDQGDSSYYYSYSNMKVTGTLKYNGVTDTITSGLAWIDRQYGPFTVGVNSNNLYEWFSLQLDDPGTVLGIPQNPSEFNIWQIFSDSTSVPYQAEWRLVSGIHSNEQQDTSSSFIFERTGYWYDPGEGKYYSQGWRFINPAKDITVDMDPPVKDQLVNVNLFRFWEGGVNLKGVIQDKNVEGVGFAEIVAGRDFLVTVPSVPSGLSIMQFSNHYQLSWNASVAGTFPIGGYRIYRSKTNDGHWKYLGSTNGLSYDDFPPSMDTLYYYTVSSFDNQTATSASNYSNPVWTAPAGQKFLQPVNFSIAASPNPVSEILSIRFTIPEGGTVKMTMNDALGRNVSILSDSYYDAGTYTVAYNTCLLSPGIYFIKLQSSEGILTHKMVR